MATDEKPVESLAASKRRKRKRKRKQSKSSTTNDTAAVVNPRKKQKNKHLTPSPKPIPRKRNWIESCSKSTGDAPSDCVAPLKCIITRVEMEEPPLTSPPSEMKGGQTAKKAKSDNEISVVLNDETEINENESQSSQVPNIASVEKKIIDYTFTQKKFFEIGRSTLLDAIIKKKVYIPVTTHKSAIGPTKWQQKRRRGELPSSPSQLHLPDGNNGDGVVNPYRKEDVPDKYWAQRKRLFSLYDKGASVGGSVDPEMWYSVTPEIIANHIADRMVTLIQQTKNDKDGNDDDSDDSSIHSSGDSSIHLFDEPNDVRKKREEIVIVDAFCGCGGNTIAFALANIKKKHAKNPTKSKVKVIAIDNNLSRLKRAARNASIYGVRTCDIIFVHADAVEALSQFNKGTKKDDGNDGYDIFSEENEKHVADVYAGFALGGIELLPDRIDGIFLSPPWGGIEYESQSSDLGFNPVLSISIISHVKRMPHTGEQTSILKDGKNDSSEPQSDRSDDTSTDDSDSGDDEAVNDIEPDQKSKDISSVTTNGGEILTMAVRAVFDESKKSGIVSYFLPRNTNGITIGKIAVESGLKGTFELEQNVVNGKVKTITAYFGHHIGDLF